MHLGSNLPEPALIQGLAQARELLVFFFLGVPLHNLAKPGNGLSPGLSLH